MVSKTFLGYNFVPTEVMKKGAVFPNFNAIGLYIIASYFDCVRKFYVLFYA